MAYRCSRCGKIVESQSVYGLPDKGCAGNNDKYHLWIKFTSAQDLANRQLAEQNALLYEIAHKEEIEAAKEAAIKEQKEKEREMRGHANYVSWASKELSELVYDLGFQGNSNLAAKLGLYLDYLADRYAYKPIEYKLLCEKGASLEMFIPKTYDYSDKEKFDTWELIANESARKIWDTYYEDERFKRFEQATSIEDRKKHFLDAFKNSECLKELNETKQPFYLDDTAWLQKMLNKYIAKIYSTDDFNKIDELMDIIDGKRTYNEILKQSTSIGFVKSNLKKYAKYNTGHLIFYCGMPVVIFLAILSTKMEHGMWLSIISVLLGVFLVICYKDM